jgi:CheY-like chemotaxis protein
MNNGDSIKPRIAVLEDHDDTRELLLISLASDFSVHDFRDAAELLAALEQGKFSAVVADIMLPGLDGYSFVKAVRQDQRFKDLCVIAVTALAMKGDREKAISVGFTDYLVKPIAPTEIAAVLWRCLKASVPDSSRPS